MKEDKIAKEVRLEIKKIFCAHKNIKLSCKAKELLKTYCEYGGACDDCGKLFRVTIEA